MAKVSPKRVGSTVLPNFFVKKNTSGDASRFVTAESGFQGVFELDQGSGTEGYVVSLPVKYFVGLNQIRVFKQFTVSGVTLWSPILLAGVEAEPDLWFEELSNTTVVIKAQDDMLLSSGDKILVDIPFTSAPAVIREKITVLGQGDKVGIELLGDGDGIVFTSQGVSHRLSISANGGISVTPV